MTTTAFEFDGFRTTKSLGIVRGITVRSRSIFGTVGASLQTLVGGNITLFTELCEKTREEAFELMMQHAQQLGANAVVGVRYDATEVMQGVTEVLCYGTAVVVERGRRGASQRLTDHTELDVANFRGNFSGCSIEQIDKSMSRSGQYRWSSVGHST